MVLLYFVSVGYLILMAQQQSVQQEYQAKEKRSREQLERTTAQKEAIVKGTRDQLLLNQLRNQDTRIPENVESIGGIRQLEHEVRMLNRRRGRVWRNAEPVSVVNEAKGQVRVRFPVAIVQRSEDELEAAEAAPADPAPLAMQPGAVIYAFEQSAAGGEGQNQRQYLGEFRVLEVSGREAVIEPLAHLLIDQRTADRLFGSSAPWIVYESMPADSAELFASFSEEQLSQILPASSVEEYLRDKTPSQQDDDPARLEGLDADGNPVRPGESPVKYRYRRLLRDYAFLLQDLDKEFAKLDALIQATTSDLKKLDNALEDARTMQADRQGEVQKLRSDLKNLIRDRKEIESYAKLLQSQIVKAENLLQEVLADNLEMSTALRTIQGDLSPVATGALDIDAL